MKSDEQENKKQDDDSSSGWVGYLSLGTQLAVTVIAMTFLGIWLDKKFNTNPWLTIICSFLGITAGLYNFIKSALKSR